MCTAAQKGCGPVMLDALYHFEFDTEKTDCCMGFLVTSLPVPICVCQQRNVSVVIYVYSQIRFVLFMESPASTWFNLTRLP